jgi:hypothetical protein
MDDFRQVSIGDNHVEADYGAVLALEAHQGDVSAYGNTLHAYYAAGNSTTVHVRAHHANLWGNDVSTHNERTTIEHALSVSAHNVTYSGNRSRCHTPTTTNVLLRATEHNERPGSLAITANTCIEPHSPEHLGLLGNLLDELKRIEDTIASELERVERGAADVNRFFRLELQRRGAQQRVRSRARTQHAAPVSLWAQGQNALVTAGQNLVSYRLWIDSPDSSEVGTVHGVFE